MKLMTIEEAPERRDCPYAIVHRVGDESYTTCEINTKFCLRESGLECAIFDEEMIYLKAQEEAEKEGIE